MLERSQRSTNMATDRANDLRAFKQYIDEQLRDGGSDMSLDDALLNWEVENQTEQEREDTLEAIREGLADVAAGRTRPAEDVIRDLCRKHNIPDPTR
jgi:predicted transcriptional regulator